MEKTEILGSSDMLTECSLWSCFKYILDNPATPFQHIYPKELEAQFYMHVHSPKQHYLQQPRSGRNPTGHWQTQGHKHTMDCCSALRKEVLTYAITWINLEDIMLSKGYRLNVSVPPKLECWSLILNGMVYSDVKPLGVIRLMLQHNPLQYSCLENPMDGGAW